MSLLDLLLPERCVACSGEGEALCAGCRGALVPIRPPICACCGAPVAWPVGRCLECAGRRLGFAQARAAVAYEGPAVQLVQAWKEGGRRCFARLAAELVATAVRRPSGDAVTFVPAAADRQLWRGHNPAERLARELATLWELPLVAGLTRARSARRQRGLSRSERRANVADAFAPRGPAPSVLVLVDDVFTSGSTAAAAARALRRAGARRVEVVTFARALRDRSGQPRR